MRLSPIVVTVLTGLLFSSVLRATDWPQFLGPSRNGMSAERGLNLKWNAKAPAMRWKVAMGDNGFAGPAVAGGKLYIIDHKGTNDIVRALDATTGKARWSFTYKDADRDNYGFSRATPTVSGGKVYTISRLGLVSCLDANTGKKVWQRNLIADFRGQRPGWDYSMSVLIDGKKAIVCPGGPNAAVAALDKDTGKTLWQGGGSDAPSYATPVVATLNGKRQYVIFNVAGVMGVDAANGARIWQFPWRTGCDVNAASPLVIGNTVFITSGYNHGCALIEVNGRTAKAKWQNREIQSHFSSPIVAGGYIYCTSDPGKLVCLDLKTGAVRWQQRGFEKGGLMAATGMLLVMDGRNGDLALVRMSPAKYEEMGRIKPLGGQSWTAPIIANGRLYIRNTRTLACLDLTL